MRLSEIPVRLLIHSSDVSTSFSRSAFDNTRSATLIPIERITAFLLCNRYTFRLIFFCAFGNELYEISLVACLCEDQRVPNGFRIAVAVANKADAVYAEQRRAA